MNFTGRKTLPHHVPPWVDPATSDYFITICCRQRGMNQLCKVGVGDKLLESAKFYYEQRKWFPWLLLLMPDHLHVLVSFGRESVDTKVVSAWKRYAATKLGVVWQMVISSIACGWRRVSPRKRITFCKTQCGRA